MKTPSKRTPLVTTTVRASDSNFVVNIFDQQNRGLFVQCRVDNLPAGPQVSALIVRRNDPSPLRPREIRRSLLSSYFDAATSAAVLSYHNARRAGLPSVNLLKTGGRSASEDFYRRLLKEFRFLQIEGRDAVSLISKRYKRHPNAVHQWLFRARQLEKGLRP